MGVMPKRIRLRVWARSFIVRSTSSAVKFPTTGWFQKIFTNLNGFPVGIAWVVVLTVICWREIFDKLEKCADACEHVGDSIETIVMKNN